MRTQLQAYLDREVIRETSGGIGVLHVITRLAGGGAGENTLLSVNGLDHGTYRVDLAIGADSEPELIKAIGLHRSVKLHLIPELVRSPNPVGDLCAVRRLRTLIRNGGYRVVHTHGAKAGIVGRIAAHRERVELIVNGIHGITFSAEMGRLRARAYRSIERRVARWTDAFVSVGEDMRRKYVAAGIGRPKQHHVIRSGMHLERFRRAAQLTATDHAALRAQLEIAPEQPVVGMVARFEPRKGHRYFLDAAARITATDDARPNAAVFLLVGDGPERDAIARYADALGLRSQLRYTGFRNDVENMFAISDVIVLTSLWEGLPRVLVQAAAVGVPAVTFAVDGAWEIVRDGETGFVVPMRDSAALARRIEQLLADPATRRRMGAAARELVTDEWSVQTMVARIDRLYRSALPAAGSGA